MIVPMQFIYLFIWGFSIPYETILLTSLRANKASRFNDVKPSLQMSLIYLALDSIFWCWTIQPGPKDKALVHAQQILLLLSLTRLGSYIIFKSLLSLYFICQVAVICCQTTKRKYKRVLQFSKTSVADITPLTETNSPQFSRPNFNRSSITGTWNT